MFSPYAIDEVDAIALADKLKELHQKDRRIISIIPSEYVGGDFDSQALCTVLIIHVSLESYVK